MQIKTCGLTEVALLRTVRPQLKTSNKKLTKLKQNNPALRPVIRDSGKQWAVQQAATEAEQ